MRFPKIIKLRLTLFQTLSNPSIIWIIIISWSNFCIKWFLMIPTPALNQPDIVYISNCISPVGYSWEHPTGTRADCIAGPETSNLYSGPWNIQPEIKRTLNVTSSFPNLKFTCSTYNAPFKPISEQQYHVIFPSRNVFF